jgi:hypothetical protein
MTLQVCKRSKIGNLAEGDITDHYLNQQIGNQVEEDFIKTPALTTKNNTEDQIENHPTPNNPYPARC